MLSCAGSDVCAGELLCVGADSALASCAGCSTTGAGSSAGAVFFTTLLRLGFTTASSVLASADSEESVSAPEFSVWDSSTAELSSELSASELAPRRFVNAIQFFSIHIICRISLKKIKREFFIGTKTHSAYIRNNQMLKTNVSWEYKSNCF